MRFNASRTPPDSVNFGQSIIRIILMQDDVTLREGLKALLESEPEFNVVGEFGNDPKSWEGIQALHASLILMDLAQAERSSARLLPEIRRLAPSTRTLVLMAQENEERIRAAQNAGADGYLFKGARRAELMRAIRTVSQGEYFLCGTLARQLLLRSSIPAFVPSPSSSAAAQSITKREREILTRIAYGHSTKEIANALHVSPKTVDKHRSNLMKKLHLHNAAALTMFAHAHGLADRPTS
jgi:two-component system response regulator NreC